MTRSRILLCLFAAMLLVTFSIAAEEPTMKPGKWEITMTMDIPGMPIKMKPITTAVCLTEEDVSSPDKSLPKPSKDDSCKILDHKVDGNKVSWKVKCEGDQPMTGSGEITFTDDSYDGTMKMETGGSEMSMKYKAKLLGPCKK